MKIVFSGNIPLQFSRSVVETHPNTDLHSITQETEFALQSCSKTIQLIATCGVCSEYCPLLTPSNKQREPALANMRVCATAARSGGRGCGVSMPASICGACCRLLPYDENRHNHSCLCPQVRVQQADGAPSWERRLQRGDESGGEGVRGIRRRHHTPLVGSSVRCRRGL